MQLDNTALKNILSNLNIEELNEMQLASLEAKPGQDVILLSITGSGKTLAFLLPLLQLLEKDNKNVQAIIIVPSRELAIQIDDVFRKMQTGFKVTLCYGGHKREIEETNLIQSPALSSAHLAALPIIYAGTTSPPKALPAWCWMSLISPSNSVSRKKWNSLSVH